MDAVRNMIAILANRICQQASRDHTQTQTLALRRPSPVEDVELVILQPPAKAKHHDGVRCDCEPESTGAAIVLAGRRAAAVQTSPQNSRTLGFPILVTNGTEEHPSPDCEQQARRDSEAWKFQRTLTYWISVMYLEGSMFFIAGAAFSFSGIGDSGKGLENAVVATPYFAGGICFVLGSYFGLLEVANAENTTGRIKLCCFFCGAAQWQRLRSSVRWQAAAGYASFFLGALFYMIDTIIGFCELSDLPSELFAWVPATLGGACFIIGGAMECHVNQVWNCDISSGAWWLSVCNFLGAILFVIAGIAGAFHAKGTLERLLVDLTHLVGSAGFMVGALCTLWLWECEQFGLGFIPGMNNFERDPVPEAGILSTQEEYECGRASPWQIPFLTMYLLNATASVLLIGLAIWPQTQRHGQYELFEAFLNFALSHAVMLLGSVVHHVPTAQRQSWLYRYIRALLALYTIHSWISIKKQLAG